jgi:HlyD family secretion protein
MAVRDTLRPSWSRIAGVLVLVLAGAGGMGAWAYQVLNRPRLPADLRTAPVRRTELNSTVTEDGEALSSERTEIECDLKDLNFRNAGREIRASGASQIIELLPEGTMVEEGDVLCRLSSSEYEEMVRLQELELQEDIAQYRTAQLRLETLEYQLREYRDGQFLQQKEKLQADITLAKADLERQKERLEWTERMVEIDYLTPTRLSLEERNLLQYELARESALTSNRNLVRFTAPKTINEIQSQIVSARVELDFQKMRVRRDEEQLAEYRQQVEYCTIRAPHAGLLVYARQRNDDVKIELGMIVRENQDLFFLPNLRKMEVQATLNESIVSRVRSGMPARVRIDALPSIVVPGEVISVAPLPISTRNRYQTQVNNYIGRIKLLEVPKGLVPGMIAEVEILVAHKPDALVIPPAALTSQDGRDACYVVEGDSVELREVTIGETLAHQVEITDGLAEGEMVVTTPNLVRAEFVERTDL